MSGISASGDRTAALPTETEPFGYRDGISHPAIEGSGIAGSNPKEQPLKAGEFVLGYPDEMGGIQKTVPEILGRNGTASSSESYTSALLSFAVFLNPTRMDQTQRN